MGRAQRGRSLRRWATAGAVVAIAVAIGVLAWTIGPPIVAAAQTRVVTSDETVRLVAAEATASIPVPQGWSVRPALGDGSRVTLGSPDGVMTVELAVTRVTDAAATRSAMAPGPTGTELREPDGEGRELTHAATTSGDAVVGSLDGGTSAVVFVSSPSPGYDSELARLLGGIGFDL